MPVYQSMVHAETVATIFREQAEGHRRGDTISLVLKPGSMVAAQRNACVRDALEMGATHVMFLDADVSMPRPGSLAMMLGALEMLDVPVVVGVYLTKPQHSDRFGVSSMPPFPPTAFSPSDPNDDFLAFKWGHLKHPLPPGPFVAPEGHITLGGTGCMLIEAETFRRVPEPWFAFVERPGQTQAFPEDWYFCVQVARAGGRVGVDPRISTVHAGSNGWHYQPQQAGALSVDVHAHARELAEAVSSGNRHDAEAVARAILADIESADAPYPATTTPGALVGDTPNDGAALLWRNAAE